jgi:DNA-binding MarR family transcriptional regulator
MVPQANIATGRGRETVLKSVKRMPATTADPSPTTHHAGEDHQDLRLWLRLLSCTTKIENQLRTRLRKQFKWTLPRFDLMAQLERNPGGLRMTALSEKLMVSCGNVTGVTDQLERDGMVTRTPDAADRRVIIVNLTPAGLKKFRVLAKAHEEWIIEILSDFSESDKKRLLSLMRSLRETLGGTTSSK